jgi:hypothetical protein
MLQRVEAAVLAVVLLSTVLLSLLFVHEARAVGEGSCVAEQISRQARLAAPLLDELLRQADFGGAHHRAHVYESFGSDERPAVQAALQQLESAADGFQLQLVDDGGRVWADSARSGSAARPLALSVDMEAIRTAAHRGGGFTSKTGHRLQYAMPLRLHPSLILLVRGRG